ncbi:alpha/beta hydrolase [Georgenia subflava]|uniref:Alpha/beta fold hydrolase n=1 Tax=Georgenia subflava TaxID=1622177 RepID=A0A6N7EHF1_9MICO|nr:alpha/beta fold hydrolase [Georgenia subflava]MPV36408.1 alpha/beta fold hydrolase [Georgenia subflava]
MGQVTEHDVATTRARIHVRDTDPGGASSPAGTVVLVHGNCSSSAFFHRLLGELPAGWRGIAPDLRGYGDTEPLPIDATRGMRDFADDLAALMDALGIERAAFVAHSAGAGAVMQLAVDHPERVGAVLLEAPASPFGFGGTGDAEGTPIWPDHAGSGGGTANPDFAAAIAAGDRTTDHPHSPLNVFRALYVAPGTELADEDLLLDSVLSTRIGEVHYPGGTVPSENWPGTGPGTTGINNALSPRYYDLSDFADVPQVGPVTWVRGDVDAIVSDTSLLDLGHLGSIGAVPGWPGADVYPAQPMVTQTRTVLDRYAAAGGRYEEVVLEGVGHSPHLEAPVRFVELLTELLARAGAPEPSLPDGAS